TIGPEPMRDELHRKRLAVIRRHQASLKMIRDVLAPLPFSDVIRRDEGLEDIDHDPGLTLEYLALDRHAVIDRIDSSLPVVAGGFGSRVGKQRLHIGMAL